MTSRVGWWVAAALVWTALAGVASAQVSDQRRIDAGSRLYASFCLTCHGPTGDSIGGVNLRTGQFKRVTTDLEIMNTILKGVPGTAMPPNNLSTGDLISLVAYLRAMKDYGARQVHVGDPARGKAIVEGKGRCLRCHRIGRQGAYLAPDLSAVGGSLSAAALLDTLLDPQSTAEPGNRTIRAVTSTGEVITGRHLNEDTWSVQIVDSHQKLVSLWKPDLKSYEILKSPMPSYTDTLSPDERSDVVGYLVTLQPPRGAGRGRGAGR